MPPQPRSISPPISRIAAILLAILGLQAWLILGNADYGHRHELWWILIAIILGLISPIRRTIDRLWEAANQIPLTKRLFIALIIAVISIPLLLWTERSQHIDIRLYFHDEFSYWLQIHMLAQGHLWMPPLPLPDYFDSFYILVRPVYASIYFPGTALLFVPALWLHLPFYAGPLTAAGLCAGLFFLIVSELLDSASALLAALLLLGTGMFRLMSITLLSEMPMLLMGLTMIFIYLRLRRTLPFSPSPCTQGEGRGEGSFDRQVSTGLSFALGAATGWAAIIRPADAACFALAIAISLILDLRTAPRKLKSKTLLPILLGALPFLLLQTIFNHALTGQYLLTPHSYYTDQNFPGPNFGFSPATAEVPHVSDVPQKQSFFETTMVHERLNHQPGDLLPVFRQRFNFTFNPALPDAFFWILIPLSLLAIWDRRLWSLWSTLPFFLICYTWYVWYRQPYSLSVFPAVILFVVAPIKYLSTTFPAARAHFRTILGFTIAALTIASFPQFDRLASDQFFHMTELSQIDSDLSAHVAPPAIVLFHFTPGLDNPEEEPVYNSDVPWPDDAPIIRAHDRNTDDSALGTPADQNRPLYEYYQKLAPERFIYIYDRHGRHPTLLRLGTPNALLGLARPTFMTIK